MQAGAEFDPVEAEGTDLGVADPPHLDVVHALVQAPRAHVLGAQRHVGAAVALAAAQFVVVVLRQQRDHPAAVLGVDPAVKDVDVVTLAQRHREAVLQILHRLQAVHDVAPHRAVLVDPRLDVDVAALDAAPQVLEPARIKLPRKRGQRIQASVVHEALALVVFGPVAGRDLVGRTLQVPAGDDELDTSQPRPHPPSPERCKDPARSRFFELRHPKRARPHRANAGDVAGLGGKDPPGDAR